MIKIHNGFTLVEMAIVLAIVALLLGGLLPTISGQMERQRRNETLKYMNEVRDALLGYALANKHLPCPDTNGDGAAEATCITAISQRGSLPYKDLGVADKDAFGSVLVYAVTKEFASTTPFTLITSGTMRICTTTACSANLTSTSVAVIVSRGSNWGTTPSPGSDEAKNTFDSVNTVDFVSHDFVQGGFDDLVIWLSKNTLLNRMVAAGQLP